jgi:hypothetical protein
MKHTQTHKNPHTHRIQSRFFGFVYEDKKYIFDWISKPTAVENAESFIQPGGERNLFCEKTKEKIKKNKNLEDFLN